MSDRDIIQEIERRLTELYRQTLWFFDDDPEDEYPRPWHPDDILNPINAVLCLIEEQRP